MSWYGVSVGGGASGGKGSSASDIGYLGDWGPLIRVMLEGINQQANAGAMADMIMGGAGFGQSRRYRQYNPYDETYGYIKRPHGGGTQRPGGGGAAGFNPNGDGTEGNGSGGGSGYDPNYDPTSGDAPPGRGGAPAGGGNMTAAPGEEGMTQSVVGQSQADTTGIPRGPSGSTNGTNNTPGALGPGQWDHGGRDMMPYGNGVGWYNDAEVGQSTAVGGGMNQFWGQHDDAPVEGQGLLGEISNYGRSPSELDERLTHDLGWQATGDLMDLEGRELGAWERFGEKNNTEANIESQLGWWQKGELTDLEQQEKHGWNQFGGPGQFDKLRGDTMTGMVGSKGYSPTERSAIMGSSLLPIQQALEAQKLEGDARQAATGNAAGRWGASNAMALDAAGKASQAGRDVEMSSAALARQERDKGLSGLGDLQGQSDARKAQSLGALTNLSSRQRENQKFGMNTGLALNEQVRGAQAASAQGIGGLGQRQRANAQWGLGALSEQNKAQKQDQLTGLGLRKDLWSDLNAQGNQGLQMAAQVGSLVTGQTDKSKQSGWNAGVSL